MKNLLKTVMGIMNFIRYNHEIETSATKKKEKTLEKKIIIFRKFGLCIFYYDLENNTLNIRSWNRSAAFFL